MADVSASTHNFSKRGGAEMRYSKPDLYELMNGVASGDAQGCVGGSAAVGVSACTVGSGDGFNKCYPGSGAGWHCGPGTAAFNGLDNCSEGTAPNDYCEVGGVA